MLSASKDHESVVRSRINEAALRLFAERGAARVNVKDLASYAGVARGTVYAHVHSPDALFGEVAAALPAGAIPPRPGPSCPARLHSVTKT